MYICVILYNHDKKSNIFEGTPEWESICEQCGLCCLVKYIDNFGNIFMTNVRSAALDQDTHKCRCYASDMDARDNGCENCIALGGMRVTRETLNNEYPVPSFCPYVKNFCNNSVAKRARHRPDIDWKNTISETELSGDDFVENHIIPGSDKYFRYNPHVNQKMHDMMKKLHNRQI